MTAVWLIGSFVALSEAAEIGGGASTMALSGAWLELREQTACEAMQDDYCLGRYGFTIRYDGRFIAGPSGRGRTVEGQLKRQELRLLRELIGKLSAGLPSEEKHCHAGGLPGVKDQVEIRFSDGQVAHVYDLGGSVGKVCYIGSRDRVRRFHAYVRNLMNRYYPVPFPTV